ncbi:hypothetical protein [Glycomyces salinus]|uniref:hypothetical protein n=1 Tax=Glycomyces salinus TaxID=980294 RepID=UPI0018EE1AFF|nr:hypothetical protein [Glycomyces salinus]
MPESEPVHLGTGVLKAKMHLNYPHVGLHVNDRAWLHPHWHLRGQVGTLTARIRSTGQELALAHGQIFCGESAIVFDSGGYDKATTEQANEQQVDLLWSRD